MIFLIIVSFFLLYNLMPLFMVGLNITFPKGFILPDILSGFNAFLYSIGFPLALVFTTIPLIISSLVPTGYG